MTALDLLLVASALGALTSVLAVLTARHPPLPPRQTRRAPRQPPRHPAPRGPLTMTDKPELIAKATSAVRHERAYIAAAAFGVPLEDVGECAGMIAHAVLSAVADDLRAEGAAQALEETADRLDLTGLERNSELSRWDYDSSSDFYEELVTEWLDARAAKLRGADHD